MIKYNFWIFIVPDKLKWMNVVGAVVSYKMTNHVLLFPYYSYIELLKL